MPVYKLNEVFYSIQGEGFWAGTPCLFLRFHSCNRVCEFCDTKREELVSILVWEKEIAHMLSCLSPSCTHLVLTGGEPFHQPHLEVLLVYLQRAGYTLHIETNGDLLPLSPSPALSSCWITVSPKTSLLLPSYVREVKWLVGDGKELWRQSLEKPSFLSHQYLQPVWSERKEVYERNLLTCFYLVKEHPHLFKLSTQQHKRWGVR